MAVFSYLRDRLRENGTVHSLIMVLVGLLGWQLSPDQVVSLTAVAIAALGGVNALTPETPSAATKQAVLDAAADLAARTATDATTVLYDKLAKKG